MAQVQDGDTVKVHYTGKFDDGTVFDTSREREPLQFKIGEGKIIKGFEQAIIGMKIGEAKTINIPMDKAYGPRRDELIVVIEKKQFPAHMVAKVGQQLRIKQPDGQSILVMVVDVSESNVTLDANHPLAGKDLTFDIELVEII